MTSFAQNLRREMDAKHLKIGDLNEALGLRRDATSLYTWLKGAHIPRKQYVKKIAKALGVTPAQLLNGTPNGQDKKPEAKIGSTLHIRLPAEDFTVRTAQVSPKLEQENLPSPALVEAWAEALDMPKPNLCSGCDARTRIAVELTQILVEAGLPSARLTGTIVQIMRRCFV